MVIILNYQKFKHKINKVKNNAKGTAYIFAGPYLEGQNCLFPSTMSILDSSYAAINFIYFIFQSTDFIERLNQTVISDLAFFPFFHISSSPERSVLDSGRAVGQ